VVQEFKEREFNFGFRGDILHLLTRRHFVFSFALVTLVDKYIGWLGQSVKIAARERSQDDL